MRMFRSAAILVCAAMAGGLVAGCGTGVGETPSASVTEAMPSSTLQTSTTIGPGTADAVSRQVEDCVVLVESSGSLGAQGWEGMAQSTGIVYSDDGIVLIPESLVVDDPTGLESLTVVLNSGDRVDAKLVLRDPVNGLAAIRIDTAGLIPGVMADSNALQSGQWLVCVSAQTAETSSTTTPGAVAGIDVELARGDTLPAWTGLIEFATEDASGSGFVPGPLFDSAGHVVGLLVAGDGAGKGWAVTAATMEAVGGEASAWLSKPIEHSDS